MVLLQGTIAPATPESGQGGNPCQGDLDSLAVFRKMASGTSFGSGRMSQGQEKRQRVWEKICPSSGPGKLSASERERKAKEFIAASGVDTEGYFNNVVKQTNHSGVTFRGQAETWLESMRNRDSEPLAPSTLAPWSYALDRKSTRLNSSHVEISYAVFCLKKKKTVISVMSCWASRPNDDAPPASLTYAVGHT